MRYTDWVLERMTDNKVTDSSEIDGYNDGSNGNVPVVDVVTNGKTHSG